MHPWERHHQRAAGEGLTLDWSRDAAAFLGRHLQGGERILELGCGQGQLALQFSEMGHGVTALDLSPTAISLARNAARNLPTPPTYLIADISQPLPLEGCSFDAVVAVLSLHYFTRAVTAAIVQEVARVLVPGGWFCFYVNSEVEQQTRIDNGAVCSTLEPGVFEETDGVVRQYFSESDLTKLLHDWEVHIREQVEIASLSRAKSCWRVLAQRGE